MRALLNLTTQNKTTKELKTLTVGVETPNDDEQLFQVVTRLADLLHGFNTPDWNARHHQSHRLPQRLLPQKSGRSA